MMAKLLSVTVALAVLLLAAAPIASQTPSGGKKTWTPPRTPDGQPDLSGVWTNVTITPLERPADLAGKAFLTEQEVAAYEKLVRERTNADRRDGGGDADVARAYNDFWWDRGRKVVGTRRTSLVTDPPDGRIPALTAEAKQRAADRAEARRGRGPSDGPEDRTLADRCIMWPNEGPPMLPSVYNNNYQIVQGPGYVVILREMIHDARVIPLDGRPALPGNIRQWLGDSRGRWEGNTLVVETRNYSGRANFRGSGENLRVVERFTRVDPETILYEFTVDEPTTWVNPWSAQIPMVRTSERVYEYACHEGNYAMESILAGARREEQKAAEAASK
jgi:hypothetical protein